MTATIVPLTARRSLAFARISPTVDQATGLPELTLALPGQAARFVDEGTDAAFVARDVIELAMADLAHLIEVLDPGARRQVDLAWEGQVGRAYRDEPVPPVESEPLAVAGSLRVDGVMRDRFVLMSRSGEFDIADDDEGRLEVTAPIGIWVRAVAELFALILADDLLGAEQVMDRAA